MPLEPLKDASGPLAALKGIALTALGFATLLPINLLQLGSLVFLPFSRKAFRAVNRWAADTWWGMCVAVGDRFYKVRVIFTGDDVPMRESAVVVANHQQMPDIPAIMKFAKTKDRLGDLKFFVKKQLKWVPGMGWGMQFLDCLYIDRDWMADRETIRKTFSRLVNDRVPVYLVSFVEGTRLTAPKLAAAQEYARTHGLRTPVHTLVPRTKGFAATIEGLRGTVDAVYDLTIAYENAVPTLWQYMKGLVRRIHVHVQRFPIADLPDSADDLRQWLHDRWREKDEFLESFYTTGAFPESAKPND